MRPTPFRPLVLAAMAALVLSGCASRKDPTAETMTTATGLGTFGAPAPGAGAGLGGDPSIVGGGIPGGTVAGGGTVGDDLYGSASSLGGIDGSALGGVGQQTTGGFAGQYADQGAYGATDGLVDGGIISAAPQYTDGTVYTDTTVYDTAAQPYDTTLFDTGSTDSGGSQFTTYNDQGSTALGGYSFPGDNGQPSYFITQVGNRVLFETDSVLLTPEARETLRRQAAWLQLHPGSNVVLEGHADERGTREYNLALGARRAEAVRAYLSSLGVSTPRLRTVSYGKERPLSLGSSPSEWAKNRRVETVPNNGASF